MTGNDIDGTLALEEFRGIYRGYKFTGIVQRRAQPVRGTGEWILTDDRYLTYSNGSGLMVNVRYRDGSIREVYPADYRTSWRNPEGDWSTLYGLSPASLSWPSLEPIDYYLTCGGYDQRFGTLEFFSRYEFVTPRWNARTMEVEMVNGSCTRGFDTPDRNVRDLFGRFPNTTFLSIYFRPDKLTEPTAALVIE